jgi:hypothetical protein
MIIVKAALVGLLASALATCLAMLLVNGALYAGAWKVIYSWVPVDTEHGGVGAVSLNPTPWLLTAAIVAFAAAFTWQFRRTTRR